MHRRFITDLPPAMLLKTSPLPPSLSRRLRLFDETPMPRLLKEMEKLAERRLKPAERGRWDEYLTKQSAALTRTKSGISDLMSELNEDRKSVV